MIVPEVSLPTLILMGILLCGLIISLILGLEIKQMASGILKITIASLGIRVLATALLKHIMLPLIEQIAKHSDIGGLAVDVGWQTIAILALDSVSHIIIMLVTLVILNLLMFILNVTKTVNIDLLNLWHFVMIALIFETATGNFLISIFIGTFYYGIVLYMSGKLASVVGKYTHVKGVTVVSGGFIFAYYLSCMINRVIDKLPIIKKVEFKLIRNKGFGHSVCESFVIGFFMGGILAFFAKYRLDQVLSTAVQVSAIMYFLPIVYKTFSEGLRLFAEPLVKKIEELFCERDINIAIDLIVFLGDKDVIVITTLMLPITLILACLLPFNTVIPLMDLPLLPCIIVPTIMASKGNTFRALISSTVLMAFILYGASEFAPYVTALTHKDNMLNNYPMVSSLALGNEFGVYGLLKLLRQMMRL